MSRSQLALPATSAEESVIVERFVEASRDLVPSLQVSLAKRFVQAGTNRVVCLAAHTSVPLNDDEVASVSDLALRLADGTNVVLSLSFFNDAYDNSDLPYSRYIYDPGRYAPQTESRLGVVLVCTALAAMSAIYLMVAGPVNPLERLSKWFPAMPPVSSNLPVHRATAPQAAPSRKSVAPASATQRQLPHKAPSRKSKPSVTAKTTSTQPTRVTKAPGQPRGLMFVPPPPPFTPVLLPASQMQPWTPPQPQATRQPVQTKAADAPAKIQGEMQVVTTGSGAEPAAVDIRTGTAFPRTQSVEPESAPVRAGKGITSPAQLERLTIPETALNWKSAPARDPAPEPPKQHVPSPVTKAHLRAPVPDQDTGPWRLERLTVPGQDSN